VALSDISYVPLKQLADVQRAALDAYADLLFTQAMPAGFIGDCSRAEVDLRHIFDSVLPAIADESRPDFPLWQEENLSVFDLGAGAGLPSLPLAILFPQHTFHLIDAQEKRCRFVTDTVTALKLGNVRVYHGVVQDFPEKYGKGIQADIVIFRAFRKILASLELSLHVLKPAPAAAKVLYWRSQTVPFSAEGLQRVKDLGFKIDSFRKFDSAMAILPRGLYTFSFSGTAAPKFPRSWKKISADKLVETES